MLQTTVKPKGLGRGRPKKIQIDLMTCCTWCKDIGEVHATVSGNFVLQTEREHCHCGGKLAFFRYSPQRDYRK
jgi:hypothetical protein